MRHLRPAALAVWALAAIHTAAQDAAPEFSLAAICATADVPDTRAEYDPVEHSDNFCALAAYEPHKARRQLDKSIRITRRLENPNRYYFDPRRNGSTGHIQLLRPWMADENAQGTARWALRRHEEDREGGGWLVWLRIIDESAPEGCARAYILALSVWGGSFFWG